MTASRLDPDRVRARLREARLMLVFTPELCGARDPLEVALELAPEIDLLQVRVKPLGVEPRLPGTPGPPAPARETREWAERLLDAFAPLERAPLVLVDDRVDVAELLAPVGCAGVHLGRHDFPVAEARAQLGPGALIGLSTHDVAQVALAAEEEVDYLGFGPIHATATKGYARGLGPDLAWVAGAGSSLPIFPIGGIDLTNAQDLARVGRAAVGSALLAKPEPAVAARRLRALLESGE